MQLQEELKVSNFANEHHKMVVNILHTSSVLSGVIKNVLADYDMTNIQYNILRILNGASPKPLSPSEIKDVMIFKNSDLTRLIDRLESKGWVNRVICPKNRRKMDVSISEAGRILLQQITPRINKITHLKLVSQISSDQAAIVNDALDELRKQLLI